MVPRGTPNNQKIMIKEYSFKAFKFVLGWVAIVAIVMLSTTVIKTATKLIVFTWNLW